MASPIDRVLLLDGQRDDLAATYGWYPDGTVIVTVREASYLYDNWVIQEETAYLEAQSYRSEDGDGLHEELRGKVRPLLAELNELVLNAFEWEFTKSIQDDYSLLDKDDPNDPRVTRHFWDLLDQIALTLNAVGSGGAELPKNPDAEEILEDIGDAARNLPTTLGGVAGALSQALAKTLAEFMKAFVSEAGFIIAGGVVIYFATKGK